MRHGDCNSHTTRVNIYAIIKTSSPSRSTHVTWGAVGEIKQLRDTIVICPASCGADIKKAQRMFVQLARRDEAILERCTLHSLPTPPCTTALFTQFPVRQLQMALPDRPIKGPTHHPKARTSMKRHNPPRLWRFILTINYSKWQTNTLITHSVSIPFISSFCLAAQSFEGTDTLVWICGRLAPRFFYLKQKSGSKQLRMSTTFWEVVSLLPSFLFLPVWYWQHYGVENDKEFQGSWKMKINTKAKSRPWNCTEDGAILSRVKQ